MPKLRSPYDREILTLAVLALGSLAAEPLYVLVDTAIVGHLGRSQLAALGLAATLLTTPFVIFNFLQYATTAQVARASGAGQAAVARRLGAQAIWLSLVIGFAVAALVAAVAEPAVGALGGGGRTADFAVTYVRISALGLPFAFLALSGQGYLRGVSDLRTPLAIVLGGNVLNVGLELLFVYELDWGIRGSAWGTVAAQAVMGGAFAVRLLSSIGAELGLRLDLVRRLLTVGRHIFVRTTALFGSFLLATAVIARFGDASLGAHQVVFQIWIFLALVLDAVAIAGQVIVGRTLGAGAVDTAYEASARMITLSVAAGVVAAALMLALQPVLPLVFTGDGAVLERIREIWPIFALMQPLNGAVFALDGILIGASDGRYLMWSMVWAFVCFAAVAVAALILDWGIVGVWAGLVVLIVVRLGTLGHRFRRRRWLVSGYA